MTLTSWVPPSTISYAYEHFKTKLCVIGFSIQLQKCGAQSPSSMPPNFNTPSQFTTPFEWIKVVGVSLGIVTFTSSFIKKVLQEDAQHVDLFPRMDDVHVAFGIQMYLLQCTPPFSTFIKSFISFDYSLHKMFWRLLGPRSFDSPKRPLAHKQTSFPITFSGVGS